MKRIFLLTLLFLLALSLPASISLAQDSKTGQGVTIWFDAGGSPGGPYNTVVQNGAQAAADDLGADVRFMYSDWSPEKMISNFKQAMANQPDGIVVMGHPGDDAYSPFIEQAVLGFPHWLDKKWVKLRCRPLVFFKGRNPHGVPGIASVNSLFVK